MSGALDDDGAAGTGPCFRSRPAQTYYGSDGTAADRKRARLAVVALYRESNQPEPRIIWCQSPFQLALMPWVLRAAARLGDETLIEDLLLSGSLIAGDGLLWRSLFENLSGQALANIGSWSRTNFAAPWIPFLPTLSSLAEEICYWLDSSKGHKKQESVRTAFQLVLDRHCGWDTGARRTLDILRSRLQLRYEPQIVARLESAPIGRVATCPASRLWRGPLNWLDAITWAMLGESGAALDTLRGLRSLERHSGFRQYMDRLEAQLDWMTSMSAFLFYPDIAFVCQRPLTVAVDEAGRPHSMDGPAVRFSDGFSMNYWRGFFLEESPVWNRHSAVLNMICHEHNVERRREMILAYGIPALLNDLGAVLVDASEAGRLYRTSRVVYDERLYVVEVVNSTPEADGSYKRYHLWVPDFVRTAREAVAWSFGLPEAGYKPSVET